MQRTVRSLAYLLSMYPGVKMYFVAPEVVRMKEDIKDYLSRCGQALPPALLCRLQSHRIIPERGLPLRS